MQEGGVSADRELAQCESSHGVRQRLSECGDDVRVRRQRDRNVVEHHYLEFFGQLFDQNVHARMISVCLPRESMDGDYRLRSVDAMFCKEGCGSPGAIDLEMKYWLTSGSIELPCSNAHTGSKQLN